MKKVIIISSMISALFCGDISGISYFNYATGDADEGEKHGFYMNRVYLTYENDVSEKVSFKFQTDVINPENGAGWELYLKNAKLDYVCKENMVLTLGLQGMNMFKVQEKTWGNRFLAKTSMDENSWSSSADLGIGVSKSFGDISASVLYTNGEGYKNPSSDNNEKISVQAMYGERNLSKAEGFNVGGVFSTLSYVHEVTEKETSAQVMGLFGGFSGSGFRGGFEYNMGTDLNLTAIDDDIETTDIDETVFYGTSSSLMSFYGTYGLSFVEGLSVMVRYDMIDTDTDADDTETTTLLAGLSYQCAEGLVVSPNMLQTTVGDEEPTTAVNLTFKFNF